MNIKKKDLSEILRGFLLYEPNKSFFNNSFIKGVSIDTREKTLKQKIFFAIKGEIFDGHDFLKSAVKKSASVLIIHKKTKEIQKIISSKPMATIIQVDDTLKALHSLASYWRKKINARVIGITGSMGKTTTKHFTSILLKDFFKLTTSPKSFNNVYGVPLTLLSAKEDTDFIIQEIGMNQKGEIKKLCDIAKPNIVAVTDIGTSHIGHLNSIEDIAQEKENIYHSKTVTKAIFNLDNPYTKAMHDKLKKLNQFKEIFCFSSKEQKQDVFLQIKKMEKSQLFISGHIQGVKGEAKVPITGKAHLTNLMTATALALSTGVKEQLIWEKIMHCNLPSGRNQWVLLHSGAHALFDGYNASPESVLALVDHLLSPAIKGEKILILGDFLELGSYLESFHKKLITKLVEKNLDLLWLIGAQAEFFKEKLKEIDQYGRWQKKTTCYFSKHFEPTLAKKILSMLNPSVTLAFKASRAMQMEKVLAYFQPLEFKNPGV